MDERVHDHLKGVCAGNFWQGDDWAQYVPVVTQWGLGLTGVPARHGFKERTALTATAYASMGLMVNGMKYTICRKRPDSYAYNSFPSGHTATAFMGAELMRMEYGWAWGSGAYALALCVGFFRIYNGRHWLSDVLAGAGVGVLSAHIAYWLLPVERRLFHWNDQLSLNLFYDKNLLGAQMRLQW